MASGAQWASFGPAPSQGTPNSMPYGHPAMHYPPPTSPYAPSTPPAAAMWHAPPPPAAYPYAPQGSPYAPQGNLYAAQGSPYAAQGNPYGPPAAGYGSPGMAPPAPSYNGALVLYNQFPLPGHTTPAPSGRPAPSPFTPGLAPLPVVPRPVTFVTQDPRAASFPCSTKSQADDPLNWITPHIFDSFAKQADIKATVKNTPLREMGVKGH